MRINGLCLVLLAATALGLGCQGALADGNSRVSNPNSLGLEVMGKGLLYDFYFDRVVSDDFLIGAGLGSIALNNVDGTSSGQTTVLIPVYVNYYFARESGSLYLSLAGTFVTNPSGANGLISSIGGVQFSSLPIVPEFGAGYEYRSDAGFLLRLTAYALLGRSLSPWFGFSVGYSF